MSKQRTTRAETILNGARDRVLRAQEAVDYAVGLLNTANVTLTAYQVVLTQLERDLAPTQRKVKDPKLEAPVVGRRSSRNKEKAAAIQSTRGDTENAGIANKVPACAVANCGQPEFALVHDAGRGESFDHLFHKEFKKKNPKDNGVLQDHSEEFHGEANA